ncbi:hypothetical protein KIPB_014160, partial [Kipferlia bialata]|eukprot:g14160.t1
MVNTGGKKRDTRGCLDFSGNDSPQIGVINPYSALSSTLYTVHPIKDGVSVSSMSIRLWVLDTEVQAEASVDGIRKK